MTLEWQNVTVPDYCLSCMRKKGTYEPIVGLHVDKHRQVVQYVRWAIAQRKPWKTLQPWSNPGKEQAHTVRSKRSILPDWIRIVAIATAAEATADNTATKIIATFTLLLW